MCEKRIVIIAVDGSENSEHAFEWYLNKMRKDNDYVNFVHVTESPSLPVFSFSGIAPTEKWEEVMKKQLKDVSKIEDLCVVKAQNCKLSYAFHHVQNETPGEGIVKKSTEINADLIIIATRGQNKLRRTILGSVSDFVLHHAGLPVAVVPPKPAADQN